MIYSKKHKFLFLKGVKVAGTSVEIALASICGEEDIISPIANIDERYRVQSGIRHAQNYGAKTSEIKAFIDWLLKIPTEQITSRQHPKGIVNNHMPLKRIYKTLHTIHPEIYDAKVLAIVRSPYQQILSRLNHKGSFKNYKSSGEAMKISTNQLKRNLDDYIKKLCGREINQFKSKNFQIYDSSFDPSIHVNFIRFEDIENQLNQTLRSLGIKDVVDLPFAKKGIQSSSNLLKEIATKEHIEIINQYHRQDFERFGYEMIN